MIKVLHGDAIAEMAKLPADSVHAIVTDPPYHLAPQRGGKTGFMNKAWDGGDVAFRVETWEAALRVLKPGGYLLSFGGTRTYHRMTCAIEDAGFEIRDCLFWLQGQGFPKSWDISKAIDAEAGVEREVVGSKAGLPGYSLADNGRTNDVYGNLHNPAAECAVTAPATTEAAQWQGWGTALKPAAEPIVLARKPLAARTVAANVLEHGTGALNIDATRVPHAGSKGSWGNGKSAGSCWSPGRENGGTEPEGRRHEAGRWPSNVIHDGSDEVEAAFAAFGEKPTGNLQPHHRLAASDNRSMSGPNYARSPRQNFGGDAGTASRFFYCAKAGKADRAESRHPTVKPLALMRWLCQLVTPPGGTILDPFAGSGTTLQAAVELGFSAIGIELEAEHVVDIHRRLDQLIHNQESQLALLA